MPVGLTTCEKFAQQKAQRFEQVLEKPMIRFSNIETTEISKAVSQRYQCNQPKQADIISKLLSNEQNGDNFVHTVKVLENKTQATQSKKTPWTVKVLNWLFEHTFEY